MQKVLLILLVLLMLCTVGVFSIKTNAVAGSLQSPEIRSESAVLIDAVSGQVLYQKNMNKKMYPASITKIMTGLLALEKGDLFQTLTMSYEAVFSIDRDSSHIALDVDEKITLEQKTLILQMCMDCLKIITTQQHMIWLKLHPPHLSFQSLLKYLVRKDMTSPQPINSWKREYSGTAINF